MPGVRRPSLDQFIVAILAGPICGALGLLLACWVGLAVCRPGAAVTWARWAEQNTPLDLTGTPEQWIHDVQLLCLTGAFAAFLLAIAFACLRFLRRTFGPPNMSRDGTARIEFSTTYPQVGRPLEGRVWLGQEPQPGEIFQVWLNCSCTIRGLKDEPDREETAFASTLKVPAVRDDQGWSVAFRFEVPVTAPASEGPGPGRFNWTLGLYAKRGRTTFSTAFELELAAAPPEEVRAVQATESPAQRELIAELEKLRNRPLQPYERAQMQAKSPEEVATLTAQAIKIRTGMGSCLKWALILFVGIPVGLIIVLYIVGHLMTKNP